MQEENRNNTPAADSGELPDVRADEDVTQAGAGGGEEPSPIKEAEKGDGFEADENKYASRIYRYRDSHSPKKKRKVSLSRKEKRIAASVGGLLAVLIAAVLCCVIFAPTLFAGSTAVTASGVRIPVYEYNFNYRFGIINFNDSYSSYLGSSAPDMNRPLSEQECYFDPNISWEDYFKMGADDLVKSAAVISAAAEKDGVGLSEKDYASVDNYINKIILRSAEHNNVEPEVFVKMMFGRTLNMKRVRACLERLSLVQSYSEHLYNGYEVTDSELEEWLGKNGSEFEGVAYYAFGFHPKDTASPESVAAAKKQARKFLQGVSDAKSFSAAAYKYAAEDEKALYEDPNASYNDYIAPDSIKDTSLADWLLEKDRKKGDTEVIYSSSYGIAYAVMFMDRGLSPKPSCSAYNIYIKSGTDKNPGADDAEASANSVLQEFVAGGATLDKFIELVHKYSDDEVSVKNDGLFEDMVPGGMMKEAADWCYESERSVGDFQIIPAEHGCYIMYFAGYGRPVYEAKAIEDIKNSYLSKTIDGLMEAAEFKETPFKNYMFRY